MNGRKMIALFMVFALTGTTMAAGATYWSHEAEGVTAVQQHSIFVELILEVEEDVEQIHEFAAVVGLIKECRQQERIFDNAVLWFNDQFLFGDKANEDVNVTPPNPNATLGVNPPNRTYNEDGSINETLQNETHWEEQGWLGGDEGFIGANTLHERWGGCFIPNGFAHAIGHNQPFGQYGISAQADVNGNEVANENQSAAPDPTPPDPFGLGTPDSSVDIVKQLILLDNDCNGCIFEYESTFYTTDPNGVEWMVDKLVWPVSLAGDLFTTGSGEDCYDGSGLTGFQDPRSSGVHADECRDWKHSEAQNNESNHRYYDADSSDSPITGDLIEPDQSHVNLVEPLYTVHLQVNPETGMGYADEALWQYEEGHLRDGMPYAIEEENNNYELCRDQLTDAHPCAIEYNFLLAIDFVAFQPSEQGAGAGANEGVSANGSATGQFGNYQADSKTHPSEDDNAAFGDSHPHNPVAPNATGPHAHSTVDLDVFFYERAPYFVESNPYWDENGAPPSVNADCSSTDEDPGDDPLAQQQQAAVENRAVMVCDTTADRGYHLHDGSQTPNPLDE